jgi:hypothetical protein
MQAHDLKGHGFSRAAKSRNAAGATPHPKKHPCLKFVPKLFGCENVNVRSENLEAFVDFWNQPIPS